MSTETSHLTALPKNIPIYTDRQTFVIEYAAGKNILHLGCVDEGLTSIKFEQGWLLHEHLFRTAKSLWGVDVDEQGLEWMRQQGYPNLYHADIEELMTQVPSLRQQTFDLILLTEVIEHLDNPGKFLQNIHPLFGEQTRLLITTPNATSLANLLQAWRGNELCHPDHNFWFSYRTLSGLLAKFGFSIEQTAVYTQHNFRRSISAHLMGKLRLPREGQAETNPQGAAAPASDSSSRRRIPRVRGWVKAVFTTLLYRFLLARNPFFADGLIVIAKPSVKS